MKDMKIASLIYAVAIAIKGNRMPKKNHEGHLSIHGSRMTKHFFKNIKPYLNQRKGKVGDEVIIESIKTNKTTWVREHWQHNGTILDLKHKMPENGLTIKCFYLLRCMDCIPLKEKWVVASQFKKQNT